MNMNGADEAGDPDNDLDLWLGQLNDLQEDLGATTLPPPSVNTRKQINPTQTMDSFGSSSMQGTDDNEDIDLDALLGELCNIESQLNTTTGELTDALHVKEKPPPPVKPKPTMVEPASGPIDISFLDDDLADFSSEIDIVKMAFGISSDSIGASSSADGGQPLPPPSLDMRPKDLPVTSRSTPNVEANHSLETQNEQTGIYNANETVVQQQGQRLDYGDHAVSVQQGHRSSLGQNAVHARPVQNVSAKSGQYVEELDGLEDEDEEPIVNSYQSHQAVVHEGQRSEVARSHSIQDDSSCSDSMSLMSGSSGISGECSQMSQAEQEQLIKQEKIKVAMEKMKEANIKKLFARIFAEDGSTKSIMADDTMNCRDVLNTILEKNHYQDDISWSLIEEIPELYMERVYEDHEMFVDNMLLWTADSVNKILLARRPETYDLFLRPEEYLLGPQPPASSLGEEARKQLLEEYFSPCKVPEVDGEIYLKAEGKKTWKKYHCVLMESGIFYNPKGKGKSSKDLQLLSHVEVMEIYRAVGWKKKYKAPTDYGFALKIQKKSKYIKYLCVEDERSLRLWLTGLRIAKHHKQIYDNFKSVNEVFRKNQKQIRDSMKSNKVNLSPPDVSHKPPVAVVTGICQNMNYSNFVDLDSNTTARIPLTTGTTRHLVRGGCSTSSSGDSGIGPDGFPAHIPHEPDLDMDFPPPPPLDDFPPPPPPATLTPTPDIPPKTGHFGLVAELHHRHSDNTRKSASRGSGSKTSSMASSSSYGDYDNPVSRSPRSSAVDYGQGSLPGHHVQQEEGFPEPPPVAKKPQVDRISPAHGRQPPPVAKKPSPEPPPVAKKPKPSVPVRADSSPFKTNASPEHGPPKVSPKPSPAVQAVRPQPPPPPMRGMSDKPPGGAPGNKAFLSNLEGVLANKRADVKTHGVNPQRVSTGEMDLPPPPPELLEGLPPKPLKKKPPPPPKRNT